MTTKSFSELGLSGELLKAIDKLGFEQPAPIQAEAIPLLLAGQDVVGQSQTGSGKTVAFAAPAIEKVVVRDRVTQVLILCPTRELAMQVCEEVHKLALFKPGLHALPIYGGQSYDRQLHGLRQGAHIVIGTPGRVLDHIGRGTLQLNAVKIVVLDEVDVMLNMGFREDIETILLATPKERQTVFFSATIPRPIQRLIETHSREPKNVRIEQEALTVPTVEQVYYEVDRRYKVELLTRLIDIHDLKLGIVFCNTRRMVDELVEHLNAQGYSADRLHGEMTQSMRDRVMGRFRKSDLEFLVATDVAARGIDVENIEVVFNYDLPYDVQDYVHRIGRTGRQGRSGRAISFVSGRETFQIRNIERYANTRIHRAEAPSIHDVEEARTNAALERVRTTLQSGDFKRQDQLIGRLVEEGFTSSDIASALLHLLQGGDDPPAATAPRREADANREPAARSRGSRYQYPDRESKETYRPHPERQTSKPVKRADDAKRPVEEPKRTPPQSPRAPRQAGNPEAGPRPAAAASRPREVRTRPGPTEIERAEGGRGTPAGQTRLFINLGEEAGLSKEDVIGAILGATGLPRKVVGTVDLRKRHLFVEVDSEHTHGIIAKLNRAQIKGINAKVKVA